MSTIADGALEPLRRALLVKTRALRPIMEIRLGAGEGRLLAEIHRLGEVIDGVGRALQSGKLVYWICPLVEESEAEGTEHLTNATKRFESLQKRFGERVGLVHGQM